MSKPYGVYCYAGGRKMDIHSNNTKTSLNISEDVIKTIIGEAINELDEAVSLANLPAKTGVFSSAGGTKPISLTIVGDFVKIDVGLNVNVECKVKDMAQTVQALIKDRVQDMTGITVSKVNIFIVGVSSENKA